MKIALYIEDGLEQIVLTPQTDTERRILSKLHDAGSREMQLHRGAFYDCQGGWTRHGLVQEEDQSTIIVLRAKS